MKKLSKKGKEIIKSIQKQIFESKNTEINEFTDYQKNILSGIKGHEYIYILDYMNDKIDLKDKKILDIGSGFCIDSLIFSLYGAKVTALDFSNKRFNMSREFLKSVNNEKISYVKGSALKLPLKGRYFDLVFCNEFISHVSSLTTAILEAKRVLKKNGILFIADTNSETLRGKMVHRPIYKKIKNDLAKDIKEIIVNHCNEKNYKLKDKDILFLTKKTMGCLIDDIYETVDFYAEFGKLKKCKIKFKYRNPKDGYYHERYFTPKHIAKRLENQGFENTFYIAPVNYRLRKYYKFLNIFLVNRIFQKLLFKKYYVLGYKK